MDVEMGGDHFWNPSTSTSKLTTDTALIRNETLFLIYLEGKGGAPFSIRLDSSASTLWLMDVFVIPKGRPGDNCYNGTDAKFNCHLRNKRLSQFSFDGFGPNSIVVS